MTPTQPGLAKKPHPGPCSLEGRGAASETPSASGKQAHKNLTGFFPASVRETKAPFRLHPSPKVPEAAPCFSGCPQKQLALVLMTQKIRIEETDDSFEVTGKKVLDLYWVSAPPSPTPLLLIKNLPGEAIAFTKLPLFAKCY